MYLVIDGEARGQGAHPTAERARVAVLVNPSAGRGRGSEAVDAVLRRLRELGADVVAYVGTSVEHSRSLVAEAAATHPTAIVVVGGDGTLSSLLDELVETGVPIALVPAGTGNDLARALGVPISVADAATLAINGRPRSIDVGHISWADGERHFMTVAALGCDANVNERTNQLRWPRGRARYYLALLVELVRLGPIAFRVALDDGDSRAMPGTLVAVGNTASYGGGMPICPAADPADGVLDVTHVAPLSRARLLRLFPLLLSGRHVDRAEVTTTRAMRVRVEANGLVVYADGERIGAGGATITVKRGALQVLVKR